MSEYGFSQEVALSVDEAERKVTEALKQEGLGVLTKIDAKEKFREMLGIGYRDYRILGAFHPASAHRAIEAEENNGLLLPGNVAVYEKNGGTVISAIRPKAAMSMIDNPALAAVADEVEGKLKNVFDSV